MYALSAAAAVLIHIHERSRGRRYGVQMRRTGHLFGPVLLIAMVLEACGGVAAPTAASATPATVTAPQASPTAAPPAPATGATAKVSGNTASNTELIAAFTAAGIPNPASWAREVMEYRPYPASDPNFTKLRNELVKYNPAPGVVDKIVATLTP